MSNGSSRWSLDLGLIRQGSTRVVSPVSRKTEDLNWSILALPTKFLPISVVECRLSGMGFTAHGYGDSLLYTASLTQAFAEAWERLWFDALADSSSAKAEFQSSSGFASGPTPDDARAFARSELIERAVFLSAWRSRTGWAKSEPVGLLNQMLIVTLQTLGWEVSIFRLSEVWLGDVLCGLATRRQGGILFDSCHQRPGRSNGGTQTKVLRSLLRTAIVLEQSPAAYAPLPERGDPLSHRNFYMNPENLAAFDFLSKTEDPSERIEIGGYDAIESKVLVDIAGFPCVAAAANPRWPRLSWGRESIPAGGNEWPHPLA